MRGSSAQRIFYPEKYERPRKSKDQSKSMPHVIPTANLNLGAPNTLCVPRNKATKVSLSAGWKHFVSLRHLLNTFHATPVVLPKVAPNMNEATIVSWIKCEGERVWSREAIMIIDSRESGMKYIATPRNGYLAGIVVKEGGVVGVGSHVAYIVRHRSDILVYNAYASRSTHDEIRASTSRKEEACVENLVEPDYERGYSITG